MREKLLIPKHIFVTNRAQQNIRTAELIDKLKKTSNSPVIKYIAFEELLQKPEQFQDKSNLILDTNNGKFIRKCPGTINALCCNYYTIDIAEGCPLDCSYCFLKTYKPYATPTLFVNIEQMLTEIKETLKVFPNMRAGTGELSDSFAFADFDDTHIKLIEAFKHYPNAILELKTKRLPIKFLPKKGNHNTVIAWSLNSATIEKEEIGAASVKSRIKCAAQLCDQGYSVAFHFDPIVQYNGFEKEYIDVVNYLLDKVPHNKIRWISLGMLRYDLSLKLHTYGLKKETKLFSRFQQPAGDGKMRYPYKTRRNFFKNFSTIIKNRGKNIPVYMCMEFKRMWDETLSVDPYHCPLLKEVYGKPETE